MEKLQLDYKKMREVCLMHTSDLIKAGSAYTYIDNKSNVLAVAHCDYVSHGAVDFVDYQYKGRHFVMSETLDDRLGVYLIMYVLPALRINVDILLTDDEEIGNSTAQEFELPAGKQYNWIFSFDRRGNDIVAYDYEDDELNSKVKAITKKDLAIGSYSDIVYLEELGVKGLNFGTGYMDEHTEGCYASEQSIRRAVGTFQAFYNKYKNVHMPHTPSGYSYRSYGSYGKTYDDSYSSRYLFKSTGREECEYCGSWDYLEYYAPLSAHMCRSCIDSINDEIKESAKFDAHIEKGELVTKSILKSRQCDYCTGYSVDVEEVVIDNKGTKKNLCVFCKAYIESHKKEPGFLEHLDWDDYSAYDGTDTYGY